MAKMFYSIEETAMKLGKTPEEVRQMASSGQLQEFRDRDKLVFKKEQVDMLSSDDGASGIPLADSKGNSGIGLSLDDSSGGGSGQIELDEPKERSGISIFDTENLEEADPSAVTRVTDATRAEELTMEAVGSGSGLLDLTREADDTSLGADLLEDVYKTDETGSAAGADTQGASGLFETTSAASDVSGSMAGSPVLAAALAEAYEGKASGWMGGMALGTLVIALIVMAGTISGLVGAGDNPIISMIAGSMPMWLGIFAGLILLPTIVGFLIAKK